MKTIAISGELPDYRLCTACRSDNDVRELTFAYDNGAFKQGTQITLCKECRKDLIEILTKADRPQGEWELDPINENIRRCSNCKASYTKDFLKGMALYAEPKEVPNFCPNCGARMFAKGINVPNKEGAVNEAD